MRWAPMLIVVAAGCPADPILPEGQFGTPIPLASGDASPLPRLFHVDEGCPGQAAAGGCPAPGADRACSPLLIDSLAPFTTLKGPDGLSFDRECIEVRAAAGLAAPMPAPQALAAAVTRFRFRDVPAIRAPAGGTPDWTWAAGDQTTVIEPDGVIGGNLMRSFAFGFRQPRDGGGSLTVFGEFPGSERDLADQGRAYIPLQFPGRLLGRDIGDRCDIGGEGCQLEGFSLQESQPNQAIQATRMVVDACVAMPPCTIRYVTDPFDPFAAGSCSRGAGPDTAQGCPAFTDPVLGGNKASLVVATGVPGLVLFDDSARRMFGTLEELPTCDAVSVDTQACREGEAGLLHFSGWPPAGDPALGDAPLLQLRVRSVGLVAGVTQSRDVGPCQRASDRFAALGQQCVRFVEAFVEAGTIEDTTPPYSSRDDGEGSDPASTSLVVLGEAAFSGEQTTPDSMRWISTLIVSATHPMTLALRRDVAPEAIQPDGLMGTALFDDSETILDYTDPNPGVRLTCLNPRSGDCLAAPDCTDDAQPACCFGLPLNLLAEFIVLAADETCCGALSASELAEIQAQGFCRGVAAL